MNPRILKRFIIGMAILTVGSFIFWDVLEDYARREPGDFHTEMGGNRLQDGLYEKALEEFALALEAMPNHRGALMGRATVFIASERYDEAIAELDYLITFLESSLEEDDQTGIAALAVAYANRGNVHDRLGDYQAALQDYIDAMRVDYEVVEGPGIVHKILYGNEGVSSVPKRARYLQEQLQLPESERVLRVPEIDDLQRMHKP